MTQSQRDLLIERVAQVEFRALHPRATVYPYAERIRLESTVRYWLDRIEAQLQGISL